MILDIYKHIISYRLYVSVYMCVCVCTCAYVCVNGHVCLYMLPASTPRHPDEGSASIALSHMSSRVISRDPSLSENFMVRMTGSTLFEKIEESPFARPEEPEDAEDNPPAVVATAAMHVGGAFRPTAHPSLVFFLEKNWRPSVAL